MLSMAISLGFLVLAWGERYGQKRRILLECHNVSLKVYIKMSITFMWYNKMQFNFGLDQELCYIRIFNSLRLSRQTVFAQGLKLLLSQSRLSYKSIVPLPSACDLQHFLPLSNENGYKEGHTPTDSGKGKAGFCLSSLSYICYMSSTNISHMMNVILQILNISHCVPLHCPQLF